MRVTERAETCAEVESRPQVRAQKPKQDRSRKTCQALVASGLTVFAKHQLSDVSVQMIAEAAGVSVGGFYRRFEDRRSFFGVVQQEAISRIWESLVVELEMAQDEGLGIDGLIERFAHVLVNAYREHRFLFVASIRNINSTEISWEPIRKLGIRFAVYFQEVLSPGLQEIGLSPTVTDFRTCQQIASALLLNAVLNDPGPHKLESEDMDKLVVQIFRLHLGLPSLEKGERS